MFSQRGNLKSVTPNKSAWPLEEVSDFKLVVSPDVVENWSDKNGGASLSWFWRKGSDDAHVILSQGDPNVLLVSKLIAQRSQTLPWRLDDPNESITIYRVKRGPGETYCSTLVADDLVLETIPFRLNCSFSEEELAQQKTGGFMVCGLVSARKCYSTMPDIFKLNYPMLWAESFMDPELQGGGLVILSGSTGSGKTTAAYGMIGARLKRMGGICLSIEDPPELELSSPEVGKGLFIQNSPKRLRHDAERRLYSVSAEQGWEHSTREMMRQLPATSRGKILFFGELKLPVVAAEAVSQADSGHLVIVTAHGGSVIDTIRRFAGKMSDHSGRPVTASLASLAGVLRAVYHLNLRADPSGEKRGDVSISKMSVEGSMLLFDRASATGSASPGLECLRNCEEKGVGELAKLTQELKMVETQLGIIKPRYEAAPVESRMGLFEEFRKNVLGRTK